MTRALSAGLLAALTALAGCSTLDSLNPFAKTAPKIKPAELELLPIGGKIETRWQAAIGSAGEYSLSPAVVDGHTFAAARDGSVARFDGGQTVWRIQTGQKLSGGVGASDSLVVVGTPKGEVLAFGAADGRPLWQARASSEILAAPLVDRGLVVIRSGDARVFAFDAVSGQRRWVYQRSTPALALRSSSGVAAGDKALYAGFPAGKLVAIDRDNGAALWEATVAQPKGATELERIADVASDPVVAAGSVCAVAYQGRVACFDVDNGRPQWARDVSSTAGLAIGGKSVYVSDEKGTVHAFERSSGASLWKQDALFMRNLTRPLALDRRVAVADFQGVVHLLDSEAGQLVARLTTDGSAVTAAPQASPEGFVIQTRNGGLYGLSVQ